MEPIRIQHNGSVTEIVLKISDLRTIINNRLNICNNPTDLEVYLEDGTVLQADHAVPRTTAQPLQVRLSTDEKSKNKFDFTLMQKGPQSLNSMTSGFASSMTSGFASSMTSGFASLNIRETAAKEKVPPPIRFSSPISFKVVLVGEGGVGKTTYCTRHRTGEFIKMYTPTLGVQVHPLLFYTTRGEVVFNVWDCAGQDMFAGLRDGYYIHAQAAMIFFDVTSKSSYKLVPDRYCDLCRVLPSKDGPNNTKIPTVPIILVANKVDIPTNASWLDNVSFHRRKNLNLFHVSSKSNYNFEKPLLCLARKLLCDPNLNFVEPPNLLFGSNTAGSAELFKKYEKELLEAESVPLPCDG